MYMRKLWTCEKGTFAKRNAKIDTLVIHWTATSDLPRVIPNLSSQKRRIMNALGAGGITQKQADKLLAEFTGEKGMSDALALCLTAAYLPRKASWNYCVASTGVDLETPEIVEFIPPWYTAHHCGPLTGAVNNRSIGIENCYPEPLFARKFSQKQAEAIFLATGWDSVFKADGPDGVPRWYPHISPDAVFRLQQLCVHLANRYKSIRAICSHYQFSPRNKVDPDPPFILPDLRKHVSGKVGREMLAAPPRR